ncbi:MAG: Fe-S protein assembly co-chaperone HscB, partial [Candidatus Bathyarchaeia archaeon]
QDYRALSLKLHPDRFQTKDVEEKNFAEQWSSHLNKAYATLKDPKLRIRYIVGLETGADMAERAEHVSSVSPAIMKLFQVVHLVCGEVDAFLEERRKVSAKIAAVSMTSHSQALTEKLRGVSSQIERTRNDFLAEIPKINEHWIPTSKPPKALIEKLEKIGADLSHLSKFDSLVAERLLALSL